MCGKPFATREFLLWASKVNQAHTGLRGAHAFCGGAAPRADGCAACGPFVIRSSAIRPDGQMCHRRPAGDRNQRAGRPFHADSRDHAPAGHNPVGVARMGWGGLPGVAACRRNPGLGDGIPLGFHAPARCARRLKSPPREHGNAPYHARSPHFVAARLSAPTGARLAAHSSLGRTAKYAAGVPPVIETNGRDARPHCGGAVRRAALPTATRLCPGAQGCPEVRGATLGRVTPSIPSTPTGLCPGGRPCCRRPIPPAGSPSRPTVLHSAPGKLSPASCPFTPAAAGAAARRIAAARGRASWPARAPR